MGISARAGEARRAANVGTVPLAFVSRTSLANSRARMVRSSMPLLCCPPVRSRWISFGAIELRLPSILCLATRTAWRKERYRVEKVRMLTKSWKDVRESIFRNAATGLQVRGKVDDSDNDSVRR